MTARVTIPLSLVAGLLPLSLAGQDFPVLTPDELARTGRIGTSVFSDRLAGICPQTFANDFVASFRLEGSKASYYGSTDLAVRVPEELPISGNPARLYWYSERFEAQSEDTLFVTVSLYNGDETLSPEISASLTVDGHRHLLTEFELAEGCWVVLASYQEQLLSFIIEASVTN